MYAEEEKLGEPNFDEVGELLLQAADCIERYGWWQANLDRTAPRGRLCAMLAISQAANELEIWRTEEAMVRLARYLSVRTAHTWNDEPGRTKDEVVAALRAAARSWSSATKSTAIAATGSFEAPGIDQTSAACRALSRLIVEWSTLKLSAISRSGSPAATRLRASRL